MCGEPARIKGKNVVETWMESWEPEKQLCVGPEMVKPEFVEVNEKLKQAGEEDECWDRECVLR